MNDALWYLRRLARMGPSEVVARLRTQAVVSLWRHRPPTLNEVPPESGRAPEPLPEWAIEAVPEAARSRLLATADELLDGRAIVLGVQRTDLKAPDWHWDPCTDRRAPADAFAFDIRYRDRAVVGDVKQLWELSRHHHLTILASAYACTGEVRYAERVAEHLKSWWTANPPLRGVHWVNGIELGIRLISWAWVRRLLARWAQVGGLFEHNQEAVRQIYAHQRWLAAIPSVGSSANNHAVAEAAGRVVAACAFPWFRETLRWQADSVRRFARELDANTFASGLNRELATGYHGLVLELGLVTLAEADAAGVPLPTSVPTALVRAMDALAAVVDVHQRPPRQGDGDDGLALVVDGDRGAGRWSSLLATGAAVAGRCEWWPARRGEDVRSVWLAALTRPRPGLPGRPVERPMHFADAGLTILRLPSAAAGEIWCRADAGPHGFLSIAAHAHADALAVEVRVDGVDVLADPGTYCYHGQPCWRSYFRSTLGHNTLEIEGRDQSEAGGPFLWTRHARSRVLVAHQESDRLGLWAGEHDGYLRRLGVRHRRRLFLEPSDSSLEIRDEVYGNTSVRCRLAFHLGPAIQVELDGTATNLAWSTEGLDHAAMFELPPALSWSAHRGSTEPPRGWYSDGFGRREPTWMLLGEGRCGGDQEPMVSRLTFLR